jgi:metal-responsive CopG/Arc/MetJ family transcriptional regulator
MAKNKKTPPPARPIHPPMKRTHRVAFLLNDEELKAVNRFVEKYQIQNTSRFMREAVIRTILKRLDEDHPTLFD